jgi:hypothetical protein
LKSERIIARQLQFPFHQMWNKVAWIARGFLVPYSTVDRWHRNLVEDPDWSPFKMAWGEHRRIFTDDIEEKMATEIREQYIKVHRLFTTEDFRSFALKWFQDVYRGVEVGTRFACSPQFISGFMKRTRFSAGVSTSKDALPQTAMTLTDSS